MANRSGQSSPSVDAAAAAMRSMSLAERNMLPPNARAPASAPVPGRIGAGPPGGGLAARRQGMKAPRLNVADIPGHMMPGGGPSGAGLGSGRPIIEEIPRRSPQQHMGTPFANFRKIVCVLFAPFPHVPGISLTFRVDPFSRHSSDPSGALNFSGKAVLHSAGVNFPNGASFAINMTQLELEEELGRGNYGTVKKVLHKPTNVHMAMKVRIPRNYRCSL